MNEDDPDILKINKCQSWLTKGPLKYIFNMSHSSKNDKGLKVSSNNRETFSTSSDKTSFYSMSTENSKNKSDSMITLTPSPVTCEASNDSNISKSFNKESLAKKMNVKTISVCKISKTSRTPLDNKKPKKISSNMDVFNFLFDSSDDFSTKKETLNLQIFFKFVIRKLNVNKSIKRKIFQQISKTINQNKYFFKSLQLSLKIMRFEKQNKSDRLSKYMAKCFLYFKEENHRAFKNLFYKLKRIYDYHVHWHYQCEYLNKLDTISYFLKTSSVSCPKEELENLPLIDLKKRERENRLLTKTCPTLTINENLFQLIYVIQRDCETLVSFRNGNKIYEEILFNVSEVLPKLFDRNLCHHNIISISEWRHTCLELTTINTEIEREILQTNNESLKRILMFYLQNIVTSLVSTPWLFSLHENNYSGRDSMYFKQSIKHTMNYELSFYRNTISMLRYCQKYKINGKHLLLNCRSKNKKISESENSCIYHNFDVNSDMFLYVRLSECVVPFVSGVYLTQITSWNIILSGNTFILSLFSNKNEMISLKEWISKNKTFSKTSLILEILKSVAFLHQWRIIHGHLTMNSFSIDCKGFLKLTDLDLTDRFLLNLSNGIYPHMSQKDKYPSDFSDVSVEKNDFLGDYLSCGIIFLSILTDGFSLSDYCSRLQIPNENLFLDKQFYYKFLCELRNDLKNDSWLEFLELFLISREKRLGKYRKVFTKKPDESVELVIVDIRNILSHVFFNCNEIVK